MTQHFSSVWHHMAKIICIVPTSTSYRSRVSILQAFTNFGFLNVITVHEDVNAVINVDVLESIIGKTRIDINPSDSLNLFPDILKDLGGFYYVIPVHDQPPIVNVRNFTVTAPMLHFLRAVVKIQKARLELNVVPDGLYFDQFWQRRQMHLTLNTAAVFDNPEPKLINYETKGFCAVVPLPQKTLTFRFMIIMPFDFLIWVPLVLSIAGSFAVWWLYRGRGAVDSQWLLLAEIYKMFFGQGFTLSRNNHFMLLTLMQLICWLIFIISNAYESEITSCMIEPYHENRLETLNDLLASDYEILTEAGFAFIVKENEQFQAVKSRITVIDFRSPEEVKDKVSNRDIVLITLCDVVENIFKSKIENGQKLSDFYYKLPEKFLSEFVRLEASYLNPFIERLQYFMDLSFQAGFPHMWKVFENLDQLRTSKTKKSDSLDSLRFEDLHEVFKVLAIGLAASALVFLLEIFYRDCLANLNGRAILEQMRLRIRGVLDRIRQNKLKVRRINVQPRNLH